MQKSAITYTICAYTPITSSCCIIRIDAKNITCIEIKFLVG